MPGWLAVIEHIPKLTKLNAAPATVQTAEVVEVYVSGRVEVAVAGRVSAVGANGTLLMGGNVIV